MKQGLILFVTLFLTLNALAQTNNRVQIKGRVYNPQSQEYMSAASISCLFAKDSSRAALTFTNLDGAFIIDNLTPGNYYLYITYLGYRPIFLSTKLLGNIATVNLGNIIMDKKIVTLSTIDIIGNKTPVRVTKDTIEFTASNLRIRENSMLDELLRKLPGVQIDPDGTIRINGEIVRSVLVDGRSIFADDPKLITKNLQAELVDKVQLIDRRVKERDPSEFSEIRTEKAINITIKRDRKKQWTGQTMAGYGSRDRFAVKANLVNFSDNGQIAMFLNGDNINGYQDEVTTTASGLSRKWSANINYIRDLTNKITLNSSYRMNNNSNENQYTSSQQNFSEDTSYYYNQQSIQKNTQTSHFIDNRIDYKIDSLWTLIYTNSITVSLENNKATNIHRTINNELQLMDSGFLENIHSIRSFALGNDLNLEKKFHKKGRILNIHLGFSKSTNNGVLYNQSNTLYIKSDDRQVIDTINQYTKLWGNGHSIQYMINYAEPIFKGHTLIISYGLNYRQNLIQRSVFNYNKLNESYDRPNDSLSYNYENLISSHFAGIGVQKRSGKYDYNVSLFTRINYINSQNSKSEKEIIMKSTFLLPRVYFNYVFSNTKRLSFYYTANQILPTSEQLQPAPDNTNPLLIKSGNPDLKSGSDHNLTLSYSFFNTRNLRYFSIGVNGNIKRNQIINSIWLDSLKRQIIKPTNMNGAFSFRLNIDNSFPIIKQKKIINTATNIAITRDVYFVNNKNGSNINLTLNQSIGYTYTHKEWLNLTAQGDINYTRTQYSDQESFTNYYNYVFSFYGNIHLPAGIVIGTNMNYSLRTGGSKEYNSNFMMINTYVSKTILKHYGLIKLQGFDLLNQNISVTRNIGPNYIEDIRLTALQRFFILSIIYFIKQHQ